jgi:surface antigen
MQKWMLVIPLLGACASTLRMPGPLAPVRSPDVAIVAPVAAPRGPAPTARPALGSPASLPRLDQVPDRPMRDSEPELDGGALADRVVASARYYLNHSLDGWRDDCSGFVCASVNRAGFEIRGNAISLWAALTEDRRTHTRRMPNPGDIAFFDQTYDRDRDGRLNDELTHVAVVLSVDEDGTIHMAHGGSSSGRTTLTMNLYHPDVRESPDGKEWNDGLRVRSSRDPNGAKYLAGELWRGFATLPDSGRG